jgi:hypothetical protein
MGLLLATIVLTLLLIGGTIAVYLGRVGKVVDDHPVCSACRRDFFGLTSNKCPDCGRGINIQRRLGVAIGNRVRRPVLLATGAVMFTIGAFLLATSLWVVISGVSWFQIAPNSVLRFQALHWSKDSRDLAMKELILRRATMTPTEQSEFDEMLLARQGDSSSVWDDSMSDWLDAAFMDGSLSPQQRIRFLENLSQGTTRCRPVVRRDGVFVLGVSRQYRMGNVFRRNHQVNYHVVRLRAAGTEFFSGRHRWTARGIPLRNQLPVGDYIVEADIEASVGTGPDDKAFPETVVKTFRMPMRVAVSAVTTSDHGINAETLRTHFQIDQGSPLPGRIRYSYDPQSMGSFSIDIVTRNLPVDVAFSGELKVGDHSWDFGRLTRVAGKREVISFYFKSSLPDLRDFLKGKTATIILRTDEAAAEETVDLIDIWKGDLVFEGVQIDVAK